MVRPLLGTSLYDFRPLFFEKPLLGHLILNSAPGLPVRRPRIVEQEKGEVEAPRGGDGPGLP